MGESLKRAWTKLPVVLRAILMGFTVLVLGVFPWSVLASANLKVGSTFPWAFFVELTYLAVLWQYLRGRGWPAATSKTRRQYLRANSVEPRLLAWSILAGSLFAGGLIAFQVVGWMLVSIPLTQLEEFALLQSYPVWTVVPLLLMGAVVTGLVEEAAFRGYMQVPIEQRHGPTIAIGIVAVIFAIAHLPAPLALPGFILSAVGWGALAYLADSILPGAVLHAGVDAAVWIWVWRNLDSLKRIYTAGVPQSNSNLPFVVAVGLTLVFWATAAFAFWKLARVRQVERLGRAAS